MYTLVRIINERGVWVFCLGLCEHEYVNCVPLISPPVRDHTLTIILCQIHDLISLFTFLLPMHAIILLQKYSPILVFYKYKENKIEFNYFLKKLQIKY